MNASDLALIEAIKVWIKDQYPDMQQYEVDLLANHHFKSVNKRMQELADYPLD